MRVYRQVHKNKISAWRKTNYKTRINSTKREALKKGITWNEEEMTLEYCIDLIQKPCYYCGNLDASILNGIDRMDGRQGYKITNCTPCCKTCNFMKKSLDILTFVERCLHIAYYHTNGVVGKQFPGSCQDSKRASCNSYKNRADKKGLQFDLSTAKFKEISSGPCHYCTKQNTSTHTNGTDRKDNNIGYTIENSLPCCRECNSMKSDLEYSAFIDKCIIIAQNVNNIGR